eukprot:COSAG02_NODE_13_length_57813_cov_14.298276_31_plen_52_part_00
MHPQLRCNFPRDQRLIVKSGYRLLKWPPIWTELWLDDSRWKVQSYSMVSRL